jgi:hypothetical protein
LNLSALAVLVLSIFGCTISLTAQALPKARASSDSMEVSASGFDNALGDKSSTASLPEAPQSQDPAPSKETEAQQDAKISASGKLPGILDPQMTQERLDTQDKFALYIHQAFNPATLLPPLVGMGISMANPPDHYPHEWKAGGGAVGRVYGDFLARREAGQAGRFLGEAAFREDPRYQPSTSSNIVARISNAVLFTLVDKSDSGHRMPALSNFVGAAASGFVGNAYLPRGYNDVTHAGQRSAVTLGGFAIGNLINEFCPEWGPQVNKLHIPFIHPPCAERMRAKEN